ncbi:MAG: (d)CMP kinase [Verrucomicrobiales bacterium]|nr:(d)CMP kinase [Verrucomicrobiales bacterium]
MKNAIVITIDGPSASGKGTCGRYLARKLGFHYVDTGAMYRTLTWHCLRTGVDITDPRRVVEVVRSWPAALDARDGEVRLLVDGVHPVAEIRTDEVSGTVAKVSPIAGVRVWMVRTQRECLRFGNLVMDGRDVGTHVFPETPFKFFLTASEEVRARRRKAEGSGENTAERDRRDAARTVAPMEAAKDALVVDNSHESPAVTAEFMLAHVESRRRQLGL